MATDMIDGGQSPPHLDRELISEQVAIVGLRALLHKKGMETDTSWGRLQGLMLGIAIMHFVQPVAYLTGMLTWRDKYIVSMCGAVLYGVSFVALMYRKKLGLLIAVIGPFFGVTAVFGGWALLLLGLSTLSVKPDPFQLTCAIMQLWAWLIAFEMLRSTAREAQPRAR